MNRRSFLKGAAGGAAGLVLITRSKTSHAFWGDIPGTDPRGTRPRAHKILEIYLRGGVAPWETFYFRPDGGRTRGFDAEVAAITWNPACPGTPSGLVTQSFGNDALGRPVELGPLVKPLWRRDIRERMRVIVTRHGAPLLDPHPAAVP